MSSIGVCALQCWNLQHKEGIVDSLPQSLLDGRPGSSLLLTPQQIQQLQQLGVGEGGGAVTVTLHGQGGGQLVLTPQSPAFYPEILTGHTTHSILHHHVRQASIIQQVGHTSSIQQVGVGVGGQASVKPGSPFSARLTPSPSHQQRVVTPQPPTIINHQVMGAPQVPQVLQIFQQATRNTVGVGSGVATVKTKQPPQILPKPPGSVATSTKATAPQPATSPAIAIPAPAQQTILLNQMIPGGVGPMLVQQQTSSGVQLILRSPPPQPPAKQPTVVLSNGPQQTVLVQHNPARAQAQPQLVRLVTGQTLQLHNIQTSSGPALIAVPAPSTPTPPPQHAQPASPKNKLKKKKKKEDEGPTRLDLANLMKLSGIDDDDVAPVSVAQQTQTPHQSPTPPPPPQPTPPAPTPPSPKQPQPAVITSSQCTNQGLRVSVGEDGRMILHQSQPQVQVSGGVTPSIAAAAQSQLAQLLASHGDGILQNNSSLAGAASKDSAALLQSLQTAVLSWANTDSLVMKAAGGVGGVALASAPQVVVRRPTNAPTSVVVANPQLLDPSHNGVIINGLHDRVLLSEQNRVQIVTSVPHSSVSFSDHNRFHTIVSRAPSASSTSMSLEQQNRVQIVSGVPTSTTMSLTEQQNRVQIVSGSQMSTGVSLTDQQSRVQIVSGVPNANLSLTEQQNRVQIVSGVPNSTLTEQQNRVQIVSGIPNSSSVALTEQNRVQIVSGVANPSGMSLSEQNRVQIVSAVPHSSAMSLEQQNRVQIVSGVHSSSAMSMTEQQNRVQIVSGITNKAMSLTEQQNRVQIISSVPSANSMSLTEQQNRVQIVSGVQNSNSLSLEQQNRVQIVSGMQTSGMSLAEQQNRVHIVSGVANSSLSCEQNRVQIVSGVSNSTGIQINEQPTNRVHVVSASTNTTDHPNRVQIVSGIPNRTATSLADRIHVVQNDQSRVQIANSVPGLSFSEHQNRVHIVSGSQNSNPVISEQNRVQIVTGVPSTNILSLSEQQSRVQILSNTSHNSVSLAPEQQRVQLVTGLGSDPTVQIITSMANTDHCRVSASNNLSINEHQRLQVVTSLAGSGGISDQQRVHIVSNMSNDRLRPHIEPQRQMQSSGVQTVEQSLRPQYQPKPPARSPQMPQYHQQTVISPRCNPAASPQSPRGSNSKSPVIYPTHSPQQNQQPSPQQHQAQPPKPTFSNRPNLTVVTQSSPSQYHHNSQTATSQSQATQHEGHSIINHYPPQFTNKPTSVHTSHAPLNHQMDSSNHPSVITSLAASCQTTTAITKPLQAVTRQPQMQRLPTTTTTTTTTTTSTSSSYQNSFLDTIAQSHPSLVINKSPTPPIASKALKPKKLPKKSAVVKPMMHEERAGTQTTTPPCEKDAEPPSLVPISTQCETTHTPNVVQRVQTIQLTPQKQQHLKAVQNQIQVLSAKKPRTPQENQSLQRLFMEQQKILFSGKLIPTIPGQHAQGITFQVSTPVRVLPAPPSSPRQPPPPPPPTTAPPPPPPPAPPPTVSKATSPIHVQVGTQTSCEPSPSPPALSLAKRAALIDQQQRADRQGATAPDVNTPFGSTSDAVKRLVRYHCLDEPVFSEGDLHKADEIFEATARHLLDKNRQMLNKYRYLLLMESMRQVQTSELIMLGRMFVSDETARLEAAKMEANAPSPPVKKEREDKIPTVKKEPEDHQEKREHHQHHNHGGGDQPQRGHDRAIKREREDADDGAGGKKHCADDEEINAQVQNAIDSILNLGNKGSDPVIDEAVRSILSS